MGNSQPSKTEPGANANLPPMMAPPMMAPPMMPPPMISNPMVPTNPMIPGQFPNGDITQHDPSAENTLNHQEGSSFSPSTDSPSAPPIFFNPSQFSSQPIQTPNM